MPALDVPELSSPLSADSTPLGIALGERPTSAVAAAVEAVGGLAWLSAIVGEVAVATVATNASGLARIGARTLVEIVTERGGRARVVAPPRSLLGSLRRMGDRDRWVEVDVPAGGARIERLPVLRDLVESPASIGVGAIGDETETGPLAIGLWSRFVHPKFAIPARLGGHRAPLAADLAIPFRPRLLVLIGRWRRLIAVVATPDLIAAELAGLAIRHGATGDPGDRPRPWEDPLVQRATELGLGVLHPSAIDLRSVWSGPSESPLGDALGSLADFVADALGISQSGTGGNTMVSDGGQP